MNDDTVSTSIRGMRGVFVVILGPDGTGKSTLAERLVSMGNAEFSGCNHFHWRPGLLPQLSRQRKTGTAAVPVQPLPPQDFAYGAVISLVRFAYYLLDFMLGYWLRIYPMRRKGMLVLGERWYFDVIINPERYGFKVPRWLRIAGGYFVPTPDVTLLLTGDPETIYARKRELDPHVIRKQLADLTQLIEGMPGATIVPTDIPLQESQARVVSVVRDAAERQ